MELVRFRGRRAAGRVGLLLAAQLAAISVDFTGAGGDFMQLMKRAHAAQSAPIVAWSAPAECPNAESIVQRLMVLGGGSARRFADAGTVRGEVLKEGEDWVLSLQIIPAGASGGVDGAVGPARVLRARDCDDLAEAGAVAIAIALGGIAEPHSESETFVPNVFTSSRNKPSSRIVTGAIGPAHTIAAPAAIAPPSLSSALEAPAENPPAPSEALAAENAPAADEAPENDEPPEPEEPSSFAFVPSAGLVLDAASLGGAAWGPAGQTELRWGSFGAGLYGYWLPRYEISLASAQSVELSLLSAGLRGCYRAGSVGPFVDVCAGAEFGSLSAAGRGLLDASRRRDPWGAASGGVLLGVELLRSLQAGARLEAVLPLWRERYLVNRNDEVHEVPRASLRVGVSVAGAFGKR